jgi:hypothetical protein
MRNSGKILNYVSNYSKFWSSGQDCEDYQVTSAQFPRGGQAREDYKVTSAQYPRGVEPSIYQAQIRDNNKMDVYTVFKLALQEILEYSITATEGEIKLHFFIHQLLK